MKFISDNCEEEFSDAVKGVMAKEEVAASLEFGQHGTTFGGNPFACAVGNACLKTIELENYTEQAGEKGSYMMEQIRIKTAGNPDVIDVRGMGLMIGVELAKPGRPVVDRMFQRGVLSNAAGGNVLRIVPPLVITQQEIDIAVDIMAECV